MPGGVARRGSGCSWFAARGGAVRPPLSSSGATSSGHAYHLTPINPNAWPRNSASSHFLELRHPVQSGDGEQQEWRGESCRPVHKGPSIQDLALQSRTCATQTPQRHTRVLMSAPSIISSNRSIRVLCVSSLRTHVAEVLEEMMHIDARVRRGVIFDALG